MTNPSHRAELLDLAEALADQIWSVRVHTREKSVTWCNPEPAAGEEFSSRTSLNPYLYDGTAGISLFLAALASVTGNSVYRERSLLALSPVRRMFAEIVADPQRAARLEKVGIGGFIGLGSLVYSFVQIGRMLEEPALTIEAGDLSQLFTPERIATDSNRDLLLGSAGAVLGLLTLHRELAERHESGRALEIACKCARNILDGRVSSADGAGAWPTLPGFPPLTGLSHGAAGICTALLRLHEKTWEPALWQAAHECLAFERRAYHAGHKNWRDTRDPDKLHFEASWCYGAPGIALARLSTLSILDGPQVREEIQNALETTRAKALTQLDHLCCGNMGRVEILLYAGSKLGDAGLRESAERLALEVLERARLAGGFRWRFDQSPGFFDPTFFTGAAGIGYTLLRLVNPQGLPCVLILE